MLTTALIIVQLLFTIVIGVAFYHSLRGQYSNKSSLEKESKKELEKLHKMRRIKLSIPLTEKTRPQEFSQIVGQDDGIKALRAILCSENPQHVLIYGPPGIGKTAAARAALNEAKRTNGSPFLPDAKFVEVDATTMRFDERSIADPLIGSVHDPIYQGAGAYGPCGVPQPKPGAVSKAHGGVLFLDEIGELHPTQTNRLLKVLEDRAVFFESAYYSSEDKNIPSHIHDMFKNGLPADFRLIGATTRLPQEIPQAIRSRCAEIFFNPLTSDQIYTIAKNAVSANHIDISPQALDIIKDYAENGRDAVNMVQRACCIAKLEQNSMIMPEDIYWVIKTGRYQKRYVKKVGGSSVVGRVTGLAVSSMNVGYVMEIEVLTSLNKKDSAKVTVNGAVEKEEIQMNNRRISVTGSIKGSVSNAIRALRNQLGEKIDNYDIHINFPGGVPVDGPSAGLAIFYAIFSSVTTFHIPEKIAITGEISASGMVYPVGGVTEKINAAIQAGVQRVYIPKDNFQENYNKLPIEVVCISHCSELIKHNNGSLRIPGIQATGT